MIVHDFQRTLRAIVRMVRLARSGEDLAASIPASISIFNTEKFACRKGVVSSYRAVIASPSGEPRVFHLILDIYKKSPDAGTDGHIGYCVTDLVTGPQPVSVEFRYDWSGTFAVDAGNGLVPPDAGWKGCAETPGVYSVRAILRTLEGVDVETLQLSQELQG